jgi:hypothetical protein
MKPKAKSIVMCIMSGSGDLCIGKECPLYKRCFPKKE